MAKNTGITSWIEYLNDPQLVAKIQAACGIKVKVSLATETRKTNSTQRKHPLRSREKVKAEGSEGVGNEDSNISQDLSSISRQFETIESSEPTQTSNGSNDFEDSDEATSQSLPALEYTIENKFWYYLAKFGGAMGDEIFYAFFFPFWFWNIDGAVCRRVVLIWGILMYIGQGLKDIIRWPRPSSPPVVRLEKKWELEYGMPSTHAIVASAIPCSVLFFTSSRYQYEFSYGLAIAIAWCSIVCMSRIYLGMHSVLDVLVGLSLVALLFPWVTSLADCLDPFILQHKYGGIYLLIGGITMAVMSPGGDKWTPARADTSMILATCVGLNMGAWLNFQLGIIRGPALDPPYPVLWPSYGMLGLSLLRLVIGLMIVFATKAVGKSVVIIALGELFKRASSSLSYRPSVPKKEVFIELTYKFIVYLSLGFNVVFLCPVVFRLIGIERTTFHTEV